MAIEPLHAGCWEILNIVIISYLSVNAILIITPATRTNRNLCLVSGKIGIGAYAAAPDEFWAEA